MEDEDFRKQGLYIYGGYLYCNIYDKYPIGCCTQILLSPDRYIEDIDDVIKLQGKTLTSYCIHVLCQCLIRLTGIDGLVITR